MDGLTAHEAATRILAIRHGETLWNRETRIQGHTDIPLSELGRSQARRLAEALAGEGIDAIYASDLSRAFETAEAVAGPMGLCVQADPGLRERGFGHFEGQTWQDIEARWPQDCARWRQRDPDFAATGGESLADFYRRAVDAVARLAAAHPGQTLLIVAHGGVMDCLYRAASRQPLNAARSWRLGNAAINRLLYSPEGFTLVGWNDDSHLEGLSADEVTS